MKNVIALILMIFNIYSLNISSVTNKFDITAGSVILMEKESKRILYEKNKDDILLTASIAKIMTAIIVIENINVEKVVEVDKETINQIGSSIYLEIGERIRIKDLLYGMMLRSGNDAAYLLAKVTGGSVKNFVYMMNNKAKELNMKRSVFTNPSGLDENTKNYSTAYDMGLLTAYAMENEIFREITNAKSYSFKTDKNKMYVFKNKHKLIIGYDYIIGGKTGYTKEAKRTLVTVAKKNDMELIVVTFNCNDDWNAHMKLLDFGYNEYEMKDIVKRGIIKIVDNKIDYVPYVPKDIKYPISINDQEKVKLITYLVINPDEDNVVGYIKLYLGDEEVFISNIYRYY